jgi:hypothetical protein
MPRALSDPAALHGKKICPSMQPMLGRKTGVALRS